MRGRIVSDERSRPGTVAATLAKPHGVNCFHIWATGVVAAGARHHVTRRGNGRQDPCPQAIGLVEVRETRID